MINDTRSRRSHQVVHGAEFEGAGAPGVESCGGFDAEDPGAEGFEGAGSESESE